ncbi:Fic family protein [uncultured Eudoraea sp.]|uniref:Fic family protein n=1 Tax=uncultured Eudoraea sp. TaxID=1035614 RepID=UPI002620A1A2|nr:Fic family protein [uncultured Eudoraea sp.]
MDNREKEILEYVREHPLGSSRNIFEGVNLEISYATVKRILAHLITQQLVGTEGRGKGTKYVISPHYNLFYPIDLEQYFVQEIDERQIQNDFDLRLISDLGRIASLFTDSEIAHLNKLQSQYQQNVSELSTSEYIRELERLAIDLSWKSSQIEGNTYSLLETERLLKEKETAEGKSKDEATMLLNHKEAIDFLIEHPDYLDPLTMANIADLHSILIKNLGISRGIRTTRVGISGTNYRPLDNEFQIREAIRDMCALINGKSIVFDKALLALVLISYIQPFGDGNKRTGRIVSNAILMNNGYCPLSFRTVASVEYKKAMLVFYEQNNISSFKELFMEQFEFAVETYF